jgi:uncharacterized protein YfaS (alpha-2-macroglobulin family)
MPKRVVALCAVLLALGGVYLVAVAAEPDAGQRRALAIAARDKGNWKDAYETGFEVLATDPEDDPKLVSDDLTNGIGCLQQLGRSDEIDAFREKTIAAHANNWRLLDTAAKTYVSGESYGFIVAGKFYRGGRRGGDGKQVTSIERDRIRAMQLMVQAMPLVANEPDKNAIGDFYFDFAAILLANRPGEGAWALQYLSDLTKLPDYQDGYFYYGQTNDRGAPVNEDGTPVYHAIPKSWNDAKTDGERWRWCLEQMAQTSDDAALHAKLIFAEFLHEQFGVQTMAAVGFPFFGRGADVGPAQDDATTRKDESGPYAVRTLGEDETIARLANGIKRFKLPEEFNFIHLFQSVAEKKSTWGERALEQLADLFENRQQYDRAAEYWKKNIADYGPGNNNYKQLRLDQILGNWAAFDPIETKPSGTNASASLLFRNGRKISFDAQEIDVKKLLDDVQAAIAARPRELDWQEIDVNNIGYRLVERNEKQYLIKQTAQWDMDLQPLAKHFDRRVKVDVPIKAPGAYLITARMDGGNTTRIILWIADTAIVQKRTEKGAYYFVADAVTGAPVPNAKMQFFGYRQEFDNNRYRITTQNIADTTDADGQCSLSAKDDGPNYQWLATATTPDGRLAYLGFTGIWGGQYYDAEYNERKAFVITDRPVYRPGQTVKFKIWLETAKYDLEGKSEFANQSAAIQLMDPRGEKVLEKTYQTDEFGGFDGEYTIPADATLGAFGVNVLGFGGGNFRVEEYKKPEYEVSVDAPTEPIQLGDKITATIKAKYYFGTPVLNAKVHYKVMREARDARWFPAAPWDWFYEPGYWWFVSDYPWYPGWKDWGMRAPLWLWWPQQSAPPEVVSENDVPIGPDGTVKVDIDTAPAKAVHGDEDQQYSITAEVTDQSRRTIVGTGEVLVARKPFSVYAWVDRGYYAAGDAIEASFSAQTLDNKPIASAKGELKLLRVTYDKDRKPIEREVEHWALDTDAQGVAHQQIKAAASGQYRLSYRVTDARGRTIEGGYVFVVRGGDFNGQQFRFNDIELTTDKKQYQAGDTVRLMINTDRPDSTVVLFLRPSNGVYLPPKVLRLKGKSTIEEVAVVKKDMPNFFIEALTVSDARVYDDLREIVVPPESRVVNVAVTPSAEKYRPGEKAKVKIKVTDAAGAPVVGSEVVSIYDKAVEYISGGSNVEEIKAFFWKWRRNHAPQTESSLDRESDPVYHSGETTMAMLGEFGDTGTFDNAPDFSLQSAAGEGGGMRRAVGGVFGFSGRMAKMAMNDAVAAAPMAAPPGSIDEAAGALKSEISARDKDGVASGINRPEAVQPTIRKNFADTALWVGRLDTNSDGTAEVELTMPESLTTWKTKVWSMSEGTRVGQGEAEVVTYKNVIVRLQAPRFFVQKDEVVLSANVHNYLKSAKQVKVTLDLGGNTLAPIVGTSLDGNLTQTVEIPADGEKRVDWWVKAVSPGTADIKVAALTDEESDAMQMSFPVEIHGMLKTDSFSGAMRPKDEQASLIFNVPAERLPEQSRVEIRYSPSVASAMVDALPYLVDYPYGCTEQTLNRFLPTVITQKVLLSMNLNLKDIEQKRTNLNAQEIGDDAKRAADWKRNNPPNPGVAERNPVFDEKVVADMTADGIARLANMQIADGGWGWFSGIGESSWPHTTALVVHGLQIAKANGVVLPGNMLERCQQWLADYQTAQVKLLENAARKIEPSKEKADDLDAFVYMVLADAGVQDRQMMNFIYRDRNGIAVYAKAMFALALEKQGEKEKLDVLLQNILQYVVEDNENQSAYLKLPAEDFWWCWYGSDTEAMGYYLKLLSRTDPHGEVAARLAKYLITNRKHASYWNSTRDTAICIEALADYVRASGEDKPDETVTISIDGKQMKQVHIDSTNLFSFDNKLVLAGNEVTTGQHTIDFAKSGAGPLYFNAYVTNFTLEDPIRKAGLEVRVQRKFYKLIEVKETTKVSGERGQALDQRVEKYQRQEIADGQALKSGDLVEVELEIDSKNDYEYVLFEDMKAAGFEPVALQSGYNGNDLNAYMELRDDRVSFFARTLARGKHSVSYRLRAEIPGKFSALPTRASAMYAPELKGNSDENKIVIED